MTHLSSGVPSDLSKRDLWPFTLCCLVIPRNSKRDPFFTDFTTKTLSHNWHNETSYYTDKIQTSSFTKMGRQLIGPSFSYYCYCDWYLFSPFNHIRPKEVFVKNTEMIKYKQLLIESIYVHNKGTSLAKVLEYYGYQGLVLSLCRLDLQGDTETREWVKNCQNVSSLLNVNNILPKHV